MSALESLPDVQSASATLKVVPQAHPSPAWRRGFFPVLILALLATGMVGHLVLQTKIQEQGFELSALQTEADRLSAEESVLHAALDTRQIPQRLALEASQLGMVANPYSTFLELPTGKITGVKRAVRGNEMPVITAIAEPASESPPDDAGPDPDPAAQQPATGVQA